MRRIRQLFTAGLLTVIMVVTAACGGQEFDASGYVQAFMDMMTKGEVENYMEITGQSEEEAKKDYTAMTDAMMEALGGVGVSEDVQGRFRDLYIKILAKAKYTVNEAEKTDDGAYKVGVAVEPITGLYEGLAEELQDEAANYASEKIASGEEINESEITDWIFNLLLDKMEGRMDSLSYGEPKTITVTLKKDGDKYVIENEDEIGQEIGEALIDTSSLE